MSHAYKSLEPEQLEEVLSNFLIESWSYSKVTSFARNEKAFEMNSIYGCHYRSSASTVAGQAYHAALDTFFRTIKENGEVIDMAALEIVGFEAIDRVGANSWKLQKTTPTVQDCQREATKKLTALLKNFLSEIATYNDGVAEILEVEVYCNEFVTVNGVDIPLPVHARIDLIVRLTSGKIAILDHKSKASFTSEQEMALSIGVQAITYVKAYEAKTGLHIDEVWFIENKISSNKDNSPQLNAYKVDLNDNTRKLYEALLYEPLRRMLSAVNDPDYVYLINDSDNFIDKAELYDFWARTMICEVEDFNVPEAKKELVSKRLKKIRDASISTISPNVIKEFKNNASAFIQYDLSGKDMTKEQKIEHALRSRGVVVNVKHTFDGYSSNTYLLEASAGVNIASIYGKKLDIANMLDVPTVRISRELVIHEGKSYLGVEFSKKRERDLIFNPEALQGMKLPLGEDNFGNTIVWDLDNHSTPHALVCGATGSGKSVCIKSTIEYAKLAGVENIIIFDPKFEFNEYENDAVVVNEISDIEEKMVEMINFMNELVRRRQRVLTLVIFDEFADAVAQSKNKSLEENLRVLLQKGRSCGIRVMAATQRASVKVITGDAKVNFPVQICFRVPKEIDSKVVIDEAGAESLAGRGDGLIKSPEYNQVVRFQAFYKP